MEHPAPKARSCMTFCPTGPGELGDVAGARSHSGPCREAAVEIQSNVPWIGFPVGYAVSGVLLTVFGYFAMLLAHLPIHRTKARDAGQARGVPPPLSRARAVPGDRRGLLDRELQGRRLQPRPRHGRALRRPSRGAVRACARLGHDQILPVGSPVAVLGYTPAYPLA